MTLLRDLTEKIHVINMRGHGMNLSDSDIDSQIESFLRAHDDELIERCIKRLEEEKNRDWGDWKAGPILIQCLIDDIRQLKVSSENR